MRHFRTAVFLSLIVWLAGCGSDPVVRQVRELRKGGAADSARALALSALEERADRLPLWLEYARSCVEVSRFRSEPDDPHATECGLHAALLCAAAVQHPSLASNRGWRETTRMATAEVARELTRVISQFTVQVQTAATLKETKRLYAGDPGLYGSVMRTEQLVESYRTEARRTLSAAVTWRRLLEMLPEVTPGMQTSLLAQLDERQSLWMIELELDPAYTAPVQQRARERVESARQRLQDDLKDVGYFLVRNVTENGVLP